MTNLRIVALGLCCALTAPPLSTLAEARPLRGTTKIFVLLCQTSDSPAPTRSADDFRRLLFRAGTGGLADYWHDISYGNFNNIGSDVFGWYRLAQTTAQFTAMARWDRVNACQDAAR